MNSMTPRKKATELVYKFYDEIKYMERAKQCALIAVDEYLLWSDKNNLDYWQQVKNEIEKL